MVTHEDLKRLRSMKFTLESKTERRDRLRSYMMGHAVVIDDMPHAPAWKDPMAEYMAKLDELERDIGKTILRLESEIQRIETEIETLQPREQMIIRLRYIDGLSWRKIAARTHYAERHCKRLHKTALEILLNS